MSIWYGYLCMDSIPINFASKKDLFFLSNNLIFFWLVVVLNRATTYICKNNGLKKWSWKYDNGNIRQQKS